jgi:hypothetical protein
MPGGEICSGENTTGKNRFARGCKNQCIIVAAGSMRPYRFIRDSQKRF